MLLIRPATLNDYLDIAKLHADSWQKHYQGIFNDEYLSTENSAHKNELWHKRLENPSANQLTLVALDQNKLVGFCCAYIDSDPIFGTLIDNLHVAPTVQKTGLGRRLLKLVDECLIRNARTKKVYLWVYELNTAARAVYEKLGGYTHETIEQKSYDGEIKKICRVTWADSTLFQ